MQKQLIGFANERAAGLAFGAFEPLSREALSPIDCAKAVEVKGICEVFDIHPDPVATRDVLDEKCTFTSFINRLFLNDKTPLGFCTHGPLSNWVDCGSGLFPRSP